MTHPQTALVPASPAPAADGADQQQYLTFSLRDEMFAVGILNVDRVLSIDEVAVLAAMAQAGKQAA